MSYIDENLETLSAQAEIAPRQGTRICQSFLPGCPQFLCTCAYSIQISKLKIQIRFPKIRIPMRTIRVSKQSSLPEIMFPMARSQSRFEVRVPVTSKIAELVPDDSDLAMRFEIGSIAFGDDVRRGRFFDFQTSRIALRHPGGDGGRVALASCPGLLRRLVVMPGMPAFHAFPAVLPADLQPFARKRESDVSDFESCFCTMNPRRPANAGFLVRLSNVFQFCDSEIQNHVFLVGSNGGKRVTL